MDKASPSCPRPSLKSKEKLRLDVNACCPRLSLTTLLFFPSFPAHCRNPPCMWLSINSFRGFPTLGKCYFTWPLRLFIVAAVYWCVTLPPARSHCRGWPFSQDTHGGPLWAPVFLSNVYIWFFLSWALSECLSLDVGPLGLGLPSHHTHIHLSGYWICILFFFSLFEEILYF